MAKISISQAVVLVFVQGTCAFIWERTKTVREEESKSDKLFSKFFTLTVHWPSRLTSSERTVVVVNSCTQGGAVASR